MGKEPALKGKIAALWLILVLLLPISCGAEGKLIHNRATLAALDSVERMEAHIGMERFRAQLNSAGRLSPAEYDALRFLYAYMPACDAWNYPLSFYLNSIRIALKARREMPWGKEVSEEMFLHFVLPERVNNEQLDTSRSLFYAELKDRVSKMDIEQAALEVNHWCRSKVTYAPSDERTRSPLATMRNALGRCGEQSTFTVAALRAVGIPARQVYTPRWAHTDDNHAWVEVYIRGKWRFMGGCEPDVALDRAWFNRAASRAMLVHTKVFGHYVPTDGQIITETNNYTEVNCTPTYASTQQIDVYVSAGGMPAEGASVAFTVYNYAEFFPVSLIRTDAQGRCNLTTGKGDMLVWAWRNDSCGYVIARADALNSLEIRLEPYGKLRFPEQMKLVPPPDVATLLPAPTEAQSRTLARRLAYDDSIRTAYEATFPQNSDILRIATGINADRDRLSRIITMARGNGRSLLAWCNAHPKLQAMGLRLLSVMSEKDATDMDTALLSQWVPRIPPDVLPEQLRYRFNPRIAAEPLTDWYAAVTRYIDESTLARFRENPHALSEYVCNFQRIDGDNTTGTYISPAAVLRYGKADLRSMRLVYVAIARTVGYAARINPLTGNAEIALSQQEGFQPASFEVDTDPRSLETGVLSLRYQGREPEESIRYYSRFSVAALHKNRPFPATLYNPESEESSFSNLFGGGENQALPCGMWLLTSGTRMASGAVVVRIAPFVINPGAETSVPLLLPQDSNELSVIGNMDCEKHYRATNGIDKSLISSVGRGYFVLALLKPGTEPTRHLLNDIEKVKVQMTAWARPFLFLFPSERDAKAFRESDYPQLPDNRSFGTDQKAVIEKMLRATVADKGSEYPVIAIADSFGRIVYYRTGYHISTGEEMVSLFPKL